MNNCKLLPPCSYQGGKQRLAKQILNIIESKIGFDFVLYDLCCGSGAVSLEAINRGYHTIMVDKGPYGAVWEKIGNNTFDLKTFQNEIEKLPNVENIQEYLKQLSSEPINLDLFTYHYLILQAGTFGSKQIWVKDNKWYNNTFRSYWMPTEISNRKSPVNPMMPMPSTLLKRVEDILTFGSSYLEGYNIDIFESIDLIQKDNRKKVIYIDPPYMNTTGYFESFDIYAVMELLQGEALFISEGCILDNCEGIILSEGRKKGNVSGVVKKEAVIEILNIKK